MKVFLTGASGILGTDIANELKKRNYEYLGFNSQDIELNNFFDVKSKIEKFNPDVILHCAAITNVDLCEDEKQKAFDINILGSQNIALAAKEIDSKIVYISSCGVYGNGKPTPYTELDDPQPLSYHHYTKLEGENRVKESNKNHLIVRPGWLFGGTIQHQKNFVEARRKEAMNKSILKSAYDKKGSPTYTADLAKQIIYLIEKNITGTFNTVNEGCATRFEYVSEILKLLKISTLVEPVNSSSFPRKANMPDNECLENYNMNINNLNIMRSWKDALSGYIKTTYQ